MATERCYNFRNNHAMINKKNSTSLTYLVCSDMYRNKQLWVMKLFFQLFIKYIGNKDYFIFVNNIQP